MALNAWQEFMSLARPQRGGRVPTFGRQPYEDPLQENMFRSWYGTHADRWGLNPDPDDPLHQYDYRAAFEAGVGPSDQHDGHWPSEFKLAAHPNRFVDGQDTITGQPAAPTKNSWEEFQELAGLTKPDFYDTPAARNMKAMGGIDPEDVDVEEANRLARQGSLARKAGSVAWKGITETPGGAFSLAALSAGASLGGGAARLASEVMPEHKQTFASLADVLSAAAHDLTPAQERAPWMQRLLSDPLRFALTTTGQSAPYMMAPPPLMAAGLMGQEVERLEGEGAPPGLGRLGAAVASGGTQALMERIPMARAMQGFAGTAARRALRGAAWEVPMEGAQVLPAVLADLSLGLREGESWGEILEKAGGDVLESMAMAVAPGLIMGAASPNQLHEPASLLEKSLDWLARRRAREELAALPDQQALADQARIERRRTSVPQASAPLGRVLEQDTAGSLMDDLELMVADLESSGPADPQVVELRKQLDELRGVRPAPVEKAKGPTAEPADRFFSTAQASEYILQQPLSLSASKKVEDALRRKDRAERKAGTRQGAAGYSQGEVDDTIASVLLGAEEGLAARRKQADLIKRAEAADPSSDAGVALGGFRIAQDRIRSLREQAGKQGGWRENNRRDLLRSAVQDLGRAEQALEKAVFVQKAAPVPGTTQAEEQEREAFSDVPSEEEMAEFERLMDAGVEPEAALEAVKPAKKKRTAEVPAQALPPERAAAREVESAKKRPPRKQRLSQREEEAVKVLRGQPQAKPNTTAEIADRFKVDEDAAQRIAESAYSPGQREEAQARAAAQPAPWTPRKGQRVRDKNTGSLGTVVAMGQDRGRIKWDYGMGSQIGGKVDNHAGAYYVPVEESAPPTTNRNLPHRRSGGSSYYITYDGSMGDRWQLVADGTPLGAPTADYKQALANLDAVAPETVKGKPGEAGFMRNPAELAVALRDKYFTPERREAFRQWLTLNFTRRRGLSEALHEPRRKWIARMDAAMLQIEEGFKELSRAVAGHDYTQGGIKSEKQLVRFLDDAFRGLVATKGRTDTQGVYHPSVLEKHAPEAVAIMDRLISQRDSFARDLRKRSAEGGAGITAEIALELERSFGLYVHRTYQAKFDPGWQERLKREHPAQFAAGLDQWVRQALEPAIAKLRELNPDLSYDAARTQVMTSWRGRWQRQRIDPETRRIKLGIVGVAPIADPGQLLLDKTYKTVGGEKGKLVYYDDQAQMADLLDDQGNVISVPFADLRQHARASVIVDNPKQVEGSFLAALRWSNRGGSMLPGSALEAGKNLNARRERDRKKPDWERALLGEVRDVRTNYMGTMAQMIHLAETDRFLHEIAEAGKREGTFFPQPEGEATERIDPDLFGLGRVEGLEQAEAAKALLEGHPDLPDEVKLGLMGIVQGVRGGPAYHPRTSPLGELYASKAIAEALRNEIKGPQSHAIKIAYGAGAIAKANLTVFSIQSSLRNYHSNAFYLMANGWNPLAVYGILDRVGKGANARTVAYSRVANDLFNLGQDARTLAQATHNPEHVDRWLTDKLAEYVRLGIAHQSTTVGALHRATRMTYQMLRNQDRPGVLRHAMKTAQDFYVAHDDFAKILAYERELAVMKEAYPDLPSLGMQPAQIAQGVTALEREGALKGQQGVMMQQAKQVMAERMLLHRNLSEQAAVKVRKTMQNYQELPEFFKMLSANPILAPFSAFRFSLVRNAYNIGKLGGEEALSDNPVIKKRGIQRLSGALLTAVFPLAWGKFLQMKSDTDDDEVDALRTIGYPWSANASLGIWSNENGEITYFDGGHLDVWDDLREPFIAAVRSGDWGDATARAFYSAWTNFVPIDEEIALAAIIDIRRNRKQTGGDIYLSSDHWLNKTRKIAMHAAVSGAAPATVRSLQKVYYAATGQRERGSTRDYKLGAEIIALGGPRFVTLVLKDRLDDHTKAFAHNLRASGDQLKATRLQDLEGNREAATRSTVQTVEGFLEQVRAYRTLGMSEVEIQDVIHDAGLSPGLARSFARLDQPAIMRNLTQKLDVRQRKLTTELGGGPTRGSFVPSRGGVR